MAKYKIVDEDVNREKERAAKTLVDSLVFGVTIAENCTVNQEKKIVASVMNGLVKNVLKHGKPYCPCRIIPLDKKDVSGVCPCNWCHDDIISKGHCHCNLFYRKEE
jgi:ferredoxin-thioredoxin reductase catalytic chain